jgi:decaprenyl-phosphate phosphoribosyltransferase
MLRGILKTLRPHQWVKNLFVLAPMFFARDLLTSLDGQAYLNLHVTGQALLATMVFCLLAGAVYTINDLADVEADRAHPVKRERPIAAGLVPEPVAKAVAAVLVIVSLAVAFLLDWRFGLVAVVYFAENLFYTFKAKKIPFLDVSLIALGFVLRVLAGGYATQIRVSEYMIACTALLALFLGFGKRRHELGIEESGKTRAALKAYTQRGLDIAVALTGLATIGTYVAYTLDPATKAFFKSDYLWLTTPFTIFGILRFLMMVSGRAGRGLKAESPTQEMLRDVPFMLNLFLWIIVVVAIVYRLKPAA